MYNPCINIERKICLDVMKNQILNLGFATLKMLRIYVVSYKVHIYVFMYKVVTKLIIAWNNSKQKYHPLDIWV